MPEFSHLKLINIMAGLLLAGCTHMQAVTPISPEAEQPTISPDYELPEVLPKGLTRFEDSPFVFVHAEHASTVGVNLLMPVPFVTDAVVDLVHHSGDAKRKAQYASIQAYALLEEKISEYEHFRPQGGDYTLYMLIPLEECVDDVYRVSLMFQLTRDDWMGRYYYHLPTPIPTDSVDSPSDTQLQVFRSELVEGFDTLMGIIEKEIGGKYPSTNTRVTVGSLYMLGGSVGGLVSPSLFKVKNAVELEASPESVVVRVPGDPEMAANNGGMAFGLHHFWRDQLHTYEREQ